MIPMMNSPDTWICDSCGEEIREAGDGRVEWLMRRLGTRHEGRRLRLVHRSDFRRITPFGDVEHPKKEACEREGFILNDLPLKDFLGADGLMTLLSWIAKGELPVHEILELTKRLHIPGYEWARPHFNDAIAEGVIAPGTVPGFYTTDDIRAVLEFFGRA